MIVENAERLHCLQSLLAVALWVGFKSDWQQCVVNRFFILFVSN